MSENITVEAGTLNEAISSAAAKLGAAGAEDISYEFVREHFRGGAYTVQITAAMCSAEDVAGRVAHREVASKAQLWMTDCLASFGSQGKVRSSLRGKDSILVEVQCDEDGSLLIGKEGRNLEAFEALMNCAVLGDAKSPSLSLDIEGYRSRGSGPSRNDARPSRDRDDRGRGDRGRGDRGRDDRGRGDRGRRPRREGDAERDQAITAETGSAIEKVLSGEESGIVLSEMNSYERHLAHTVVKDAEGVGSRSVGSGPDRRVEVFAE
jgi:predicted RNA-binding protein Jag